MLWKTQRKAFENLSHGPHEHQLRGLLPMFDELGFLKQDWLLATNLNSKHEKKDLRLVRMGWLA